MFELERYAAILLVFDDRETNDAHERDRYLGEGEGGRKIFREGCNLLIRCRNAKLFIQSIHFFSISSEDFKKNLTAMMNIFKFPD